MRTLLILLVLAGTASADPIRKPSAPVTVSLESKPISGGYLVTLIAAPTRAVPTIELRLAGKSLSFGATAAGQRRELTTHVAVARGEGLDVIGGALAAGRNKAAVLHVGAAVRSAPKRTTTVTLRDGREVQESR